MWNIICILDVRRIRLKDSRSDLTVIKDKMVKLNNAVTVTRTATKERNEVAEANKCNRLEAWEKQKALIDEIRAKIIRRKVGICAMYKLDCGIIFFSSLLQSIEIRSQYESELEAEYELVRKSLEEDIAECAALEAKIKKVREGKTAKSAKKTNANALKQMKYFTPYTL